MFQFFGWLTRKENANPIEYVFLYKNVLSDYTLIFYLSEKLLLNFSCLFWHFDIGKFDQKMSDLATIGTKKNGKMEKLIKFLESPQFWSLSMCF